MTISRTSLPGVGVCHAVLTESRQRIGVVTHADGRRDLVLYDPADPSDPDRAARVIALTQAEAIQLAALIA
jgi:TrkA domain protein